MTPRLHALRALTLVPPGDPDNDSDADEWALPSVFAVARALSLAGVRGHREWEIARASGGGEVVVHMGPTPIAAVTLRAFTFSYGGPEWADSDPACLFRLARVLDLAGWQQTPWRSLKPGQVFYVWRWGGHTASRGSKTLDAVFPEVTWEQLEEAWDEGGVHRFDR